MLASAIPVVASAENFPAGQFEPSTLVAATNDLESEIKGDHVPHHKIGDMLIEAPFLRRQVRVIYTGQHRKMDETAISFYQSYEKAHMVQNSAAGRYHDAYLFEENGVNYWLPVQDQVASYFPKELKPGDSVQLYLLVTGGYLQSSGWTWILPVEEFRAAK